MSTTKDQIRAWLESGKGASHMIVACDTYDHDDYPVYVQPGEDVKKRVAELNNPGQMSRVMEVYSYARDLDAQLNEFRAYHLD